jgi:hypothetical protein
VSTDIPVFDTLIRNSGNIADEMQGVLFFFYANAKNGLVLPRKSNPGSGIVQTNPSSPLESFLECATGRRCNLMPIGGFFFCVSTMTTVSPIMLPKLAP